MKKNKINLILYIFLFLFAGLLIFKVCNQSNQSSLAMAFQLQFTGEYSQNGGEWQPLEKDTELSAFDGDVILRGNFEPELPEGVYINFYLKHIGMKISINGEEPYEMSNEIYPELCGTDWQMWILPAMSEGDVIEIQLHNPHSYGNKDAYKDFLNSIYLGGETQLKQHYEKEEMLYRYFCIFLLVVSIALIGTATGYHLLHLPNSATLLKMGLVSLLMGAYMYFDTKGIVLQSNQIVFNTYMRQIAMMLAAWMFVSVIMELVEGKRRKIAQIAVYALAFADLVCMVQSFTGAIRIYDAGIYWAVVQGIVSLIMIFLCVRELKEREKHERIMLISAVVLSIVLIAELVNACMSWWASGRCVKFVFGVFFLFLLLWAVKQMAVNYQASIRAKELEKELKENQMSLAISQIQPHFIYNSLNTIYHLCEKDVGMAQQAISDFSDYLRRSLNAVDRTTLIPIEEELQHVKTYLNLEQLRFGKRLNVQYHIEQGAFMLPALSVQPLVENAVKHGICHKEEGEGTLILTVTERSDYYEILVSDDGVGFVPGVETGENVHVGIRNVRQRLDIMCHATLEIQSEPGKGTTATIHIPKEKDA